MKFFVLLGLLSSAAFGKVGQSASYQLKLQDHKGTLVYKIDSEDASEYTVSEAITFGGQNENASSKVKKDSIMTKDRASQILTYCTQLGHKLEKVGKLKACKVKANNVYLRDIVQEVEARHNFTIDYVWIGSVPVYGVVKFTADNGLVAVVQNYKW